MTNATEKYRETEGLLEQLKDLLFEIQLWEGSIKTTREINGFFPNINDAYFMKKIRKYESDIERLKNEYNCLLNTLEPFRDEDEQAELRDITTKDSFGKAEQAVQKIQDADKGVDMREIRNQALQAIEDVKMGITPRYGLH